jgi:hypothetical protein
MISTKKIKLFTSKSILLFINLLFVYKYLGRYIGSSLTFTLFLAAFYIALLFFTNKIKIPGKKSYWFNWGLIFLFIGLAIFAFQQIPPISLNVDRWSVITSFWDSFLNREYPYKAESHMGNVPGPMPFYFILALPFYFIGELGYLTIAGFLLFIYIIEKLKIPESQKFFLTAFLICSAFFQWDLVCRSNIFFNAILILGCLIWFNMIEKQKFNRKLILNAIISGFVLSTRTVLVIPYIVTYFYTLKAKKITILNLMYFGIILILAFLITFIPFILNHFQDFLETNPFIVQSSSLIPLPYTIGFIILTIVTAFLCKSETDTYFLSGLTLFISILIYFIYYIALHGLYKAYLESMVDISYFIFCVPFLLIYILIIESAPENNN